MIARTFALCLAAVLQTASLAQAQTVASPSPMPVASPSPTPVRAPAEANGVTLPDDWVPDAQLYARAEAALPLEWRWRSLRVSALSARVMAAATLSDAVQLLERFNTRFSHGRPTIVAHVTLCGGPGAILTTHAGPVVDEFVLESVNGIVYALTYTHGGAYERAEDPATEAFVRTACPTSPASFAALRAPAGWVPAPTIHVVAAWSGGELGDSFEIISGPRERLTETMNSASHPRTIEQIALTDVHNTFSTHCGHFAREETFTMQSGSRRLLLDMMYLRVNDRDATLLTYTTMQPTRDPSVVAAMRAYCPQ